MQTGFEFKKQRAIPVITGIVVAEEQESIVLEVSGRSLSASPSLM
jgi:xeroderma pigmentosum group C-complementing protein